MKFKAQVRDRASQNCRWCTPTIERLIASQLRNLISHKYFCYKGRHTVPRAMIIRARSTFWPTIVFVADGGSYIQESPNISHCIPGISFVFMHF